MKLASNPSNYRFSHYLYLILHIFLFAHLVLTQEDKTKISDKPNDLINLKLNYKTVNPSSKSSQNKMRVLVKKVLYPKSNENQTSLNRRGAILSAMASAGRFYAPKVRGLVPNLKRLWDSIKTGASKAVNYVKNKINPSQGTTVKNAKKAEELKQVADATMDRVESSIDSGLSSEPLDNNLASSASKRSELSDSSLRDTMFDKPDSLNDEKRHKKRSISHEEYKDDDSKDLESENKSSSSKADKLCGTLSKRNRSLLYDSQDLFEKNEENLENVWSLLRYVKVLDSSEPLEFISIPKRKDMLRPGIAILKNSRNLNQYWPLLVAIEKVVKKKVCISFYNLHRGKLVQKIIPISQVAHIITTQLSLN